MKLLAYATVALISLTPSCDEDKEGQTLGAPRVEPPVTRNMPDGFSSASLALLDANSMASVLKNYLYPSGDGPSPIKRLASIDEEMSSLELRAKESKRKCQESGPAEWELPAPLPTSESMTINLQCLEVRSPELTVAFGAQGGIFSLVGHTGSTEEEAIVILNNTAIDGSSTEVWEFGYQANPIYGSGTGLSGPLFSALHIKGDDDSGIEVTSAGNNAGYDLACGIHLKSDKVNLYVKGALNAVGVCNDTAEYCYNAVTLEEADLSTCKDAGLDVFELTTLTPEILASQLDSSLPILNEKVTGYTDFNTDAD